MQVKHFDIPHEDCEIPESTITNTTEVASDEGQDIVEPSHSIPHDETLKPPENKRPSISYSDCTNKSGSEFPVTSINGGFEEILERLGCFGPFQVLTLVSYLLLEIAAAFVVFIPIFDARQSESSSSALHNCSEDHGSVIITSESASASLVNYSISGDIMETRGSMFLEYESQSFNLTSLAEQVFLYFSQYESIIDEWDLRCDKAWIPDLFTSCMMAGMMIGNLITCQVADWYGRRVAYIQVILLMFIGTSLSALSPSPYVYAVARFVAGVGFCGIMNVSSMAVMEFMTPKWRSLSNCLGPMGEGLMLLSLLAYFVHPWRLLYLATLVPYILIIPVYIFLPESPRWLLRNNRVTEAHDVLGYMAKINGKQPVSMEVLEALRKQEEAESESLKGKKMSYTQFLRNKHLLVTSIYLFAIWFSWNMSYYGISYNIRNVPGDQYLNVMLIGLANAIGQRLSMPVSECFGRRRAVLYAMSTCAAFLVGLAICFLTIEVTSLMILIVCFVGLMGMACTRAAARLLSGESFPTAVRTMGLGLGGLGANISGLVTPQVAFLGSKWPALPFFVFATISVLGSLVVFMMKETRGAPLTDEVKVTNKCTKSNIE